MYINSVIAFSSLLIIASALKYEGDRCSILGKSGVCTLLEKCQYAINLLKENKRPEHCGFDGVMPIVCCPMISSSRSKQSCFRYILNTVRKIRQTEQGINNNQSFSNNLVTTTPHNNTITHNNNNTITRKLNNEPVYDFSNMTFEVAGGYYTALYEFPHMVALGYGEKNDIQYQCGAAIIDEQFVITAAHCLYSIEYGPVRWVRAGDGNIKNDADDQHVQLVEVGEVFKHPDYRPPIQYHDIALLKFKTPLMITDVVRPACLHVDYQLPDEELIAIGWGRVQYTVDGDGSLLKVNVTKFSHESCMRIYNDVARRLPQGIRDESMICAGGVDEVKDTCQGDSGGPLQVKKTIRQTDIVGITSFGKGCGINNIPGVYTRVSYYYPWIERIVWPNN